MPQAINFDDVDERFRRNLYIPPENAFESDPFSMNTQHTQTESTASSSVPPSHVTEDFELFQVTPSKRNEDSDLRTYKVTTKLLPFVFGKSKNDKIMSPERTRDRKMQELYNMLLRYIGAAFMISQYLKSRPDVRQKSLGSKMLHLVIPTAVGYVMGGVVTPISFMLMLLKGLERRLGVTSKA